MRRPSIPHAKLPRTSSVAAILAASLTAAAVARGACPEGEKIELETTLHALASIAREIGGEHVLVEALGEPCADPHSTRKRSRARLSDLFVDSGHELAPGNEITAHVLHAGEGRRLLQAPGLVTRAAVLAGGERHASGNPHLWLEPFVGHVYARNLEAALARHSPPNAPIFAKNREAFDQKLDEAIFGSELTRIVGGAHLGRLNREGKLDDFLASHEHEGRPLTERLAGLLAEARPLRGLKLIGYHPSWSYFAETYGCEIVGDLEPRPGIAPTPAHLDALAARARREGVRVVLRSPYEPAPVIESFAARIGARVALVPTDVGSEGTADWLSFHQLLVSRVNDALRLVLATPDSGRPIAG